MSDSTPAFAPIPEIPPIGGSFRKEADGTIRPTDAVSAQRAAEYFAGRHEAAELVTTTQAPEDAPADAPPASDEETI